jgi:signal transduction histidine kinase
MVRKQRFSIGPVDVPGLIRGVLALAGPRLADDGIDVTVACDPGIPHVAGDEILLQQALLNLVANSAEAIRTLGTTSATVKAPGGSQRAPGAISIRGLRDGDSVELAVIDNGGGIRDAAVDTVLQPFKTTKEQGLGMGLPIVASIVEQHEGTMRIDNDPRRGVTVAIRLPAWQGR